MRALRSSTGQATKTAEQLEAPTPCGHLRTPLRPGAGSCIASGRLDPGLCERSEMQTPWMLTCTLRSRDDVGSGVEFFYPPLRCEGVGRQGHRNRYTPHTRVDMRLYVRQRGNSRAGKHTGICCTPHGKTSGWAKPLSVKPLPPPPLPGFNIPVSDIVGSSSSSTARIDGMSHFQPLPVRKQGG